MGYAIRSHPMGRRAFLRQGAVGLVGAGLARFPAGGPADAEQSEKTKLVLVRHEDATDQDGAGKPDIVREMVHRAVCELAGGKPMADAWRTFVSPDDVVGLKVNVRGGRRLSPQVCTVDAIVEGLKAAGVQENNILIWDVWNRELSTAGYTINESGKGVRCYGSDHGTSTHRKRGGRLAAWRAVKKFYASEPAAVADKNVWLTKILTEEVSALINVPLIKDHPIAGVTIAMKNLFGAIANPWDLHGDRCDPYVAKLNALPAIKDKTRLILVDGLRGLYNAGPMDNPQWRFRPNAIIAGTDPVAVDALGLRIIEEKRKEAALPPIGDRAKHIATAAELGLGTNDFARIDLREIDLAGGDKA